MEKLATTLTKPQQALVNQAKFIADQAELLCGKLNELDMQAEMATCLNMQDTATRLKNDLIEKFLLENMFPKSDDV